MKIFLYNTKFLKNTNIDMYMMIFYKPAGSSEANEITNSFKFYFFNILKIRFTPTVYCYT